jgi:hypothetical protein
MVTVLDWKWLFFGPRNKKFMPTYGGDENNEQLQFWGILSNLERIYIISRVLFIQVDLSDSPNVNND